MTFARLSCGAIVDSAGRVFPDELTASRYASWLPDACVLGVDWRASLDVLVEQRLTDIHDECTHSREALADFLEFVEPIRRDLWRRLEYYEKHCTRTRAAFGLRPFCWSLESPDTVKAAFRDYRGKPSVPFTAAEMVDKRAAYVANEGVNPYLVPKVVLAKPVPVDWRDFFGLSDEQAEAVIFDVLHTWNVSPKR